MYKIIRHLYNAPADTKHVSNRMEDETSLICVYLFIFTVWDKDYCSDTCQLEYSAKKKTIVKNVVHKCWFI